MEMALPNESGAGLIFVGKSIEKDGPCSYRAFTCHPGAHPETRDLVIVFPDDATIPAESARYEETASSQLLSYRPYPTLPDWAMPLVRYLHVVSPEFWDSSLPESWLSASITVSR